MTLGAVAGGRYIASRKLHGSEKADQQEKRDKSSKLSFSVVFNILLHILKLFSFGIYFVGVQDSTRSGLSTRLVQFLGRPIVKIHCLAHRLHLGAKWSLKNVLFVQSMTNEIYKFYFGHSHKRRAHILQFSGLDDFYLNYIFDVRWVASERRALQRFYEKFDVIVADLKMVIEQTNMEFDQLTISKATGILNTITDKNFLMFLAFFNDVLNHISLFSKEIQTREGILINQAEYLRRLRDSLLRTSSLNDENLKTLLENCICANDESFETAQPVCTLHDMETTKYVKCKSVD